MRQQSEVWFVPSAIRGFGVVHWKGPVFIVAMTLIGVPATLFALETENTHPALSAVGVIISIGAIIASYYVCAIHTAGGEGEADDLPVQPDHWRMLPRWVKAVSIGVGLPAWIVLAVDVWTGRVEARTHTAAFMIFAAVALLQIACLVRSHWRMDL